jgi:hypothetical protein
MTFSAAAALAPIKLWNGSSDGSVYLEAKKTFLEFYTDERKAIKRSACARSASADSYLKWEQSSVSTPTTVTRTPTNRSASPSNHSQDLDSIASTDRPHCQSPHAAPYARTQHDVTSPTGSQKSKPGYPPVLQMIPIAAPVEPSVNVNEPERQTPPSSPGKPASKSDRLACKKQDLKKFNSEAVPEDQVTTLMVRGIPCSFSQDLMMSIIDNADLTAKYNFFYLPRAGNNGSNLGYAFINFVDHESAEKMSTHFNGLPLDPSRSMKVCTISPADIQGLANLRKHFRRTAVSRGCRGPVFLKTFAGASQSKEHAQTKDPQ